MRIAPIWSPLLRQCKNVKVEGIQIDSCANQNNDGIDIDCCQDVFVSNCRIRSGDDAITLKTSSTESCKNIVVTNCILSSRWAAFRVGAESRGDFQNIAVSNCIIHDTFGCGIKLQMIEGAKMKDLVFSNLVMNNVTGPISAAGKLGFRLHSEERK